MMRVSMRSSLAWVCGCTVVLASCDTGTDPGEAVATLSVVPTVDSLEIGESVTLSVVARDSAGAPISPQLLFASTAPAVAGVSADGVVTGVNLGDAVITITVGAVAATMNVAVFGPPVALVLTVDGGTILLGDSLVVSGSAKDGLGRVVPTPVSFTSLDPAVVQVSGGVIRTAGAGVGRIRAAAGAVADTIAFEVLEATHPVGVVTASATVTSRPYGVAISSRGFALLTRLDAAQASYDSIGGALTFGSAINVGGTPTSVAFSPDGARAYTADQGGTISVINTATRQRIDSVRIQGSAFMVAVDSTGTIWAGSNQAWVYRIDPVTFARDSVDVGNYVNGFAFANNRVFATDPASGTIAVINPVTLTFALTNVGGTPQGIAVGAGAIYVARDGGQVLVLNPVTATVTDSINVMGGFGVAVSPDGARLYITRRTQGLAIIDLSNGGVTNLGPGGDLRRVAFDRVGTVALVADQSNRVLVIR